MNFYYVYILESLKEPVRFYVRLTEELKTRLQKHNSGGLPHTSMFCPWKIKTAVAFSNKSRAQDFERYLKTASGRAFAKKRL